MRFFMINLKSMVNLIFFFIIHKLPNRIKNQLIIVAKTIQYIHQNFRKIKFSIMFKIAVIHTKIALCLIFHIPANIFKFIPIKIVKITVKLAN